MASFLDKVKLNTAVTKFNKFDLSCDHITTTDWMHLSPVYNKEMIPKEKLSINVEAMARLAPMSVPTFGRGNINLRAFFVPYRTIFPAWNDFITDVSHTPFNSTTSSGSLVSSVPTVTNYALRTLFVGDQGENPLYGYCTFVDNPNSEVYDYRFQDDTDNYYYLKLTPKGRRVIKILESLGYKIQWRVFAQGTEPTFSALPILAFAKVYCDWYWPQQYSESLSEIQTFFKQDSTTTFNLTSYNLKKIFDIVDLVCYDSDYFTSAWDNPVAPNSGGYSDVQVPDITNGQTSSTSSISVVKTSPTAGTINGTPWISRDATTNVAQPGAITQYAVDALKAVTDYMKRHQIAGAKALDRFFSRFGVALPAEKLNRCVYIGSKLVPLQIGDVTSTSDTTGLQQTNDPFGYDRLGSFAGRGVGYGQGNFDFETDEYGMIIVCSSVIPSVGYYQGIDRNIMHINKLDFYTPEFDQLGTQAIAATELVVPTDGAYQEDVLLQNAIFGYAPRYAEYKIAKDKVTGDFRYPSMNESLMTNNGWHFMRQFPESEKDALDLDQYGTASWITHSKEFVQGKDANQFNRIFQSYSVDEQLADHLAVIYHFDVGVVAPMHKLWDTYEFDESNRGKEVTMDVNGVKMN